MKNNGDRKNGEKNEEKLHFAISNHEIGFLNFLKFIAFTILVTFYEVKLIVHRSSHLEVFCKKGVLKDFTKFVRIHLCRNVFFNKVASLHL